MKVNPLLTGMLVLSNAARAAKEPENTGDNPAKHHFQNPSLTNLNRVPANFGKGNFFHQMVAEYFAPVCTPDMDPSGRKLPPQNNKQPSGHAAHIFQKKFQKRTLLAPGAVQVTRADLGFKENQIVMLDVGGEGQKIFLNNGEEFKSGSAHAINLNAQLELSSTPINITLEPEGSSLLASRGSIIPNLIRPAEEWPASNYKGPLFPFVKGFSNLSLMEGAPMYDYHVRELARTTDKEGWIVLVVSDFFENKIQELAGRHNDGTVWKFSSNSGDFARYVLPPKTKANRPELHDQFQDISSHGLFDIVQKLHNS